MKNKPKYPKAAKAAKAMKGLKVVKASQTFTKDTGLVSGTLRANENGYGFLIPEEEGVQDVFIPRHAMSTAMNNDKVAVRLDDPAEQRDPSKGPSGKIIRILERGNTIVVGTLAASKQFFYVIPDDPKLFTDIYIGNDSLGGASVNDRVVARVTEWVSKHTCPEGVISEVLGKSSDPKVDLAATLKKYNFLPDFPPAVMEEAHTIPEVIRPEWLNGRRDFRNQTVITIDPGDAKDFDDAISLEKGPDGFILGVHIADVSFYVREKTAMDTDARTRGTSVYLPGCVIPMLPERLSNGVCSLKEAQDRLTKTVLFHCTAKAEIKKVEIVRSVIRSVKRFSYEEVLAIITTEKPVVTPEVSPLVPVLKQMAALAREFHRSRVRRGSLMLNIPKAKVVLDAEYRPTGVLKETSDEAHSLIEEFMLLANEAVARFIMDKGRPGIYRVHEQPERQPFEEFAVFVRGLGFAVHTQDISLHEIQNLLLRVKDKPEEAIVNIHLLRSMKLAVYSSRCLGHFALALKFYTHFTSPIRRYPDLIVHRILDQIWDRSPNPISAAEITGIAAYTSRTERKAEEAERELTKIKLLQFLAAMSKNHARRVYSAMITGIKNFGFFVELDDTLVDGMVHLSSIKDDFYDADLRLQCVTGRRNHRKYRVGQRVDVRIEKIDMAKRQVDFLLT